MAVLPRVLEETRLRLVLDLFDICVMTSEEWEQKGQTIVEEMVEDLRFDAMTTTATIEEGEHEDCDSSTENLV